MSYVMHKKEAIKWLLEQADEQMFDIKEWGCSKRSRSANGYLHTLIGKLAAATGKDKDGIIAEAIQRNKAMWTDADGKPILVTLRNSANIGSVPGYWAKVETRGDLTAYIRLKGTSDMDTREFSRVLDDVIRQCQSAGVDVVPPEELKRLSGYM